MSEGTEIFIIVNNNAARAREAWGRAGRALRESGVRFEAHEARRAGDAQRAAREALRAGYRTIAVVGGDGTLGEVVSGFFEPEPGIAAGNTESDAPVNKVPAPVNSDAALAVLPAGTGNDFARGLEGTRALLDVWLARLLKHARAAQSGAGATLNGGALTTMTPTTRAVDVLRGTVGVERRGFFCLNAATLGIGAEVAGRVAAQGLTVRRLPGEARFALAAFVSVARWRGRRVRVSVDGRAVAECATNLVAVANSPYAGGGMMFSPEARVDDGLLDVVTACGLTRAVLVREMARIHRGGHVVNPRVRIDRGQHVRIESLTPADALAVEADGDVRGHTPLEFRVLAGALQVVV